MALAAPLSVPVELRLGSDGSRPGARGGSRERWPPGPRWFRLSSAVSIEGLLFPRPLPDELIGPLTATFVLPEAGSALVLEAQAITVRGGHDADGGDDRPRLLGVRFLQPSAEAVATLSRYVEARLLE